MNVVGIIAEYNPFHHGHAYQIQKLKEECQADYVIAAMSGNFVQRGAPAIIDKYSRAKMALSCGADLVLELPVLFSTASAEFFSRGAVSLLDAAGVITHLGFGAETSDLNLLSQLASILFVQPKPYGKVLKKSLKEGFSFPAARTKALNYYLNLPKEFSEISQGEFSAVSSVGGSRPVFTADHISELLSAPNNILALEYLKALTALNSGMIPVLIERNGGGYHDLTLSQNLCSASAIRSFLKKNADLRQKPRPLPETAMPKTAYDILQTYPYPFLFEDDFSAMLQYELLDHDINKIAAWADSSFALARRLLKEQEYFTNWSGFCQRMKTKNITYTRLSRLFVHMLLHITQEEMTSASPGYLRVLGFRKSASALLRALKSHSSLPLLIRAADAPRILTAKDQRLLAADLRASSLYRIALAQKGFPGQKNDYRRQVIRL